MQEEYDFSRPTLKGWECPRCGKIHAPWIQECNCPRPNHTIVNTWRPNTETPINPPTQPPWKVNETWCRSEDLDYPNNICKNH